MGGPVRSGKVRIRGGRGVMAVLVAATACGTIASMIVVRTLRRANAAPLARLAAATGHHRVMLPRLTGGFAHGPCPPGLPNSLVAGVLCEESTSMTVAQRERLGTLAAAMRSHAATDTASALLRHAFGSWKLVWRDPVSAIEELHVAARFAPNDATVQSDLGAAFLQRAAIEQDPLFLLDAYAAIEAALALEPRLPEAMFNRALALQLLYLDDPARAAWSSYLEIEHGSPWAEEAESHRQALLNRRPDWKTAQQKLRATPGASDSAIRRIAGEYPSGFRTEVQRGAVEWARDYLSGATRADSVMLESLRLARALGVATRDPHWVDILQSVDDARASGDRSRVAVVARGVLSYDQGARYVSRIVLDSAGT